MKYPHPHKCVPYDPGGFPRLSRRTRNTGKSSSARGRCGNHPDFEPVVMQRFGNHFTAFCAHCVEVGKRIHARITEQLKNEAAQTTSPQINSPRSAPNYHILRREAVA